MMGLKSQARYHARPLLIGAAIAVAAALGVAAWMPRAAPVGVALSDIPFYRMPFGPAEDVIGPGRHQGSGALAEPR